MFSGLPLCCTHAGRLALPLTLLDVSPGAPPDPLTAGLNDISAAPRFAQWTSAEIGKFA
jgi:hypothetical protein